MSCQSNTTPITVKGPFDDTVRMAIHQCKDLRNTGCLIAYMQGDNMEIAAEAALAMASVGDTLALDAIKALYVRAKNIEDTALAHRVQRHAALALFHCGGRLWPSVADNFMEHAIGADTKRLVLRAIGRCSPVPYASAWPQRLAYSVPREQLGSVQLAYELCARGYADPVLVAFGLEQLMDKNPVGLRRQAAAYLARLQRIKDFAWPLPPKPLLAAFKAEHDAVAKMFLALSLSMLPIDETENTLLESLSTPLDYRVHCQIINALGPDFGFKLQRAVSQKIGTDNPHVELAVANCIVRNHTDYPKATLDTLIGRALGWRARSSVLQAMALGSTDCSVQIANALDKAAHGFERSAIYTWMGQMNSRYLGLLLTRYEVEKDMNAQSDALLAMSGAVTNQDEGHTAHLKEEVLALLGKGLLSANAYRAYVSANGLLQEAFEKEVLQAMGLDFDSLANTWSLPQYYETRWELEKLALKAQGLDFEKHMVPNPYNNPIDWNWVKQLPAHPIIRMETTKGVVDMEFDLPSAPGSVGYITRLIHQGFYNGLSFHRVVGCFVAQGGDPTGSGSGGPEGSLRSEHSHNTYREGAVGLASSGKDTEGCQFFITHNHTPHLNGRYTILGYVVGGLDVVHQLDVGDRILRMEWLMDK